MAAYKIGCGWRNTEKVFALYDKFLNFSLSRNPMKCGANVFRIGQAKPYGILVIFCMSEYIKDGVVLSYTVEDPEGRYFVRPPMTEWELQEEERMQQRMNRSDDDLPF